MGNTLEGASLGRSTPVKRHPGNIALVILGLSMGREEAPPAAPGDGWLDVMVAPVFLHGAAKVDLA